jgi:VWFA-related protein
MFDLCLKPTGWCGAYIVLAFALLAAAQAIDPDEIRVKSQTYVPHRSTLRVETNLVELGVVVRDNNGGAVPGLTKENFRIHDNGKERDIADFAVDSSASAAAPMAPTGGKSEVTPKPGAARPRFIALYFDDVNSKDEQHANDLKLTREAAGKFVKEALQSGAKIGVFTASGAPALDFTGDLTKLIESIGSVRAHGRLSESGASVCAAVTPYVAYLIAVRHETEARNEVAYQCKGSEEVIKAQAEETWRREKELATETLESIGRVADHLATMPGTRVLLLASSGFLTGTLEQRRDEIVSRALHADVVINALDSKGLDGWRPVEPSVPLTGTRVPAGLAHQKFEVDQVGLRVEAMNEPLAALAEGTGGIFFHNNNDLDTGFRELAVPPEITYRLSFRLTDGAQADRYHKLTVKVVNARYKSVQSRPGYFAPAPKASEEENTPSKFDREVMGADTRDDFPVQLSARNNQLASGAMTVSVVANVDISKLNFGKQKGRRSQRIRFVTALMDAQGAMVAAKEATMDLALKEETYNRFAKTGLNAKLTLEVPPGVYKLREVVEEIEGKMACSTNPIEVR